MPLGGTLGQAVERSGLLAPQQAETLGKLGAGSCVGIGRIRRRLPAARRPAKVGGHEEIMPIG